MIIEKDNKNSTIKSFYFTLDKKSEKIPKDLDDIIEKFIEKENDINSIHNSKISSDKVLEKIGESLPKGYEYENNKKNSIKIRLDDDKVKNIKEFRVDALNKEKNIIIEIEAGRAVSNYQFLKDLMECSFISKKKRVYINGDKYIFNEKLYLVLAVKNEYKIKSNTSHDFDTVRKWFNTIELSGLDLSVAGVLVIGY